MGGGVGISLHGRFRIVTNKFLFAMPETAIGLFPDVGGSYFLSRCPHSIGMYLGLTGDRVFCDDALFLGLATHVVDADYLDALEVGLAKLDLSNGLSNEDMDAFLQQFASCAHEKKVGPIERDAALIADIFSRASVEEIVEASKGTPFIDSLLPRCPMSMLVAFEAQKRVLEGDLSLQDTFEMEYIVAVHMTSRPDFLEGVRAAVIDKDNKPAWSADPTLDRTQAQDVVSPIFDTPLTLPPVGPHSENCHLTLSLDKL